MCQDADTFCMASEILSLFVTTYFTLICSSPLPFTWHKFACISIQRRVECSRRKDNVNRTCPIQIVLPQFKDYSAKDSESFLTKTHELFMKNDFFFFTNQAEYLSTCMFYQMLCVQPVLKMFEWISPKYNRNMQYGLVYAMFEDS